MKLLRVGAKGAEKPAILHTDGTYRDLSSIVPDLKGDALTPAGLAKIRAADPGKLPVLDSKLRIGPCVGNVGKFICVGLNYADHAAETGAAIPAEPILFMKATSAIIGPNDDVICPRTPPKPDWEVELGVVIGKEARYVDEKDALDHVAGYCVVNDLSERALPERARRPVDQGQVGRHLRPDRPLAGHRRRSPRPAEPEDVARGRRPPLPERLDQDDDLRRRHVVSYISQFMSLQPGDVISTGTPPGVGMGIKPNPVWLKPRPDDAPRHRRPRRADPAHRRLRGLIWYASSPHAGPPGGAAPPFSMADGADHRDRSRSSASTRQTSVTTDRVPSWPGQLSPASRIPARSGSAPRSRA